MRSMEDQLKDIGLANSHGLGLSGDQKSHGQEPSRVRDTATKLLLELPKIGRVTRIEEERGFGFVAADGGGDELFFHLKGYAGRRAGTDVLPPPNTTLLLITGSDRRRQVGKQVVRWYPLAEVPVLADDPTIDQKRYDLLRRDQLMSMSWAGLWQLLRADWYCRQWGNAAPADLDDPVFAQVWRSRLGEIDVNDLADGRFWDQLSHCRYEFAAQLHPGHPRRIFEIDLFGPRQLAALDTPNVSWMQNASDKLKIRLMEWRLLRREADGHGDDWSPWFQGTESFERELAAKLLDERFEADRFIDDWLARLACNALLLPTEAAQWAERSSSTALRLFEYLPQETKSAYFAAWRADPKKLIVTEQFWSRLVTILTSEALAIDLETDGESIWEVGCARGNLSRRLHDRGSEEDLATAMDELGVQIRSAPLIVGHNFLAWDWPIIQRFISPEFLPLIWDTLLVQFLLNPQAQTHALGGNHHADGDAQASWGLFEKQISKFTPEFARSILAGEIDDAGQIIEAMPAALQEALQYAREMPADIAAHADPHDLVILPQEQLRTFDWVPHVKVVPADLVEGLPPELREIDVEALERNVQEANLGQPAAKVVIAVARLAADQGIGIRRNMIPFWLLEGDPALASAIDRAAAVPQVDGGWRVAPMPCRPEWWHNADFGGYCLAAGGPDVLTLNRHQRSTGDIGEDFQDGQPASLIRLKSRDGMTDWARADRAAHILERRGGLLGFSTWRIPDGLKRLPSRTAAPVSIRAVLAVDFH